MNPKLRLTVSISLFTSIVSPESKKEIRNAVKVDSKRLNNYEPAEVIDHLNTRLDESVINMSFFDLIETAIQYHPEGKKFGLPHCFAAIFELLDLLGYWKDGQTDTSNVARLWDSHHAYFASFCDFFVCNDRNTRKKAEVVYQLYNITTTIVSSNRM